MGVDMDGGVTMEFVWIEPGVFTMGAAEDEPGQLPGQVEQPQHEVRLSHGFYLAKFEVTQRQWETLMGTQPWTACSMPRTAELLYASARLRSARTRADVSGTIP